MKELKNIGQRTSDPEKESLSTKWLYRRLLFTVVCCVVSFTQLFASDLFAKETDAELRDVDLVINTVAPQIAITGVVRDSEGPLPGVNVMVKGSNTGDVTDFDGNFSIEVDNSEAVLIFSSVGFITQELKVGSNTSLDILMQADVQSLDEVVVIGYTTRKKGDVTGAVAQIDSKTITRTSNQNMEKALSGKVAGLIVNDRGGYPGSNESTLLIRGKSTLNNNSPLILIDNIAAGSFSHLAPNDIESISVLKDGAAAIYGARAANGVILVTTKRGKSGKPQLNFSTSYNMSSFSATPKLMNSEQYAIYENEISDRNGTDRRFTDEDIAKYASGEDQLNYPSTDWSDLTFNDSNPESRTSLSLSGGGDNVNYFVSGDYLDQQGMYASGDLTFKQYQIRSNLDIKIVDNFKVGVDLSGRFGARSQPGVDDGYIYKHIYTNEPGEVGVYPNGLPGWGGENGANPYVMSSNDSGFIDQDDTDLRGRFSFDWNLPWITEGLSIKGFAGVRKMNNDIKSWYTPWTTYQYQQSTDEYVPSQGFSQRGNTRILRESFWKYDELMLNARIDYARTFGDHSVSGFIGYEQRESQTRTFWAERRGFPDDQHSELFAGSDDGQQSSGGSSEAARQNYFISASYDYKKKYFIDVTVRHDGSSNFGEGNRFGTFPGVAASWAIGKEDFLSNANWLDALKLRASWAIMGNDLTGPYQFLTRYNYGGVTNSPRPNYWVVGGTAENGYSPANAPNKDITWETADMKNIGINFLMFEGRFSGDINWFYQKREDILVTRVAAIPDAAGIPLPAENLGKVDNWGWEFDFGWNEQRGDWTYNIGANLTQAKNEVVYLAEPLDVIPGMEREGHPMDSYIVYPTAGIFRDQAQVDATAVKKDGTVEGEPIYLDTNGNGQIDGGDKQRTYTSNTPEIQYGIYGGFSWKNLDFSVLFQGQSNAEIMVYFDQGGAKPDYVFNDRWTPDNRDANYPRAAQASDPYSGYQSIGPEINNGTDGYEVADLYYEDASYIRLREMEVAYTFNKDKIKIGDLRLYLRGFNMFTFGSDIYDKNLDPEAVGYNNFRSGTYPSLTTYSVGLNFSF